MKGKRKMQQKESHIPVVFTPDEKFIVPTCVAILSMLRTKKRETHYKFFFVVSDKFDTQYFKYLKQVEKLEREFSFQIIYINSDTFDKQKIAAKHISTSTYYRLILADILKDYDKCMYHDGDIIVNDDLQEMFDIDLKGCYIAGVKAIASHQDTEKNMNLMKEWNFPSFDNYIYAGDLICNLSKMRKDNIVAEFRNQMAKGYPSADQDVINFCCYGKIYFLPLRFCVLNRWIHNNALAEMRKQIYTSDEIVEAKKTPAIIHFAGVVTKPWYNLRTAFAEEWWKYAREILDEEEYRQWYGNAKENTIKRDWFYLNEKIRQYESVMIFGYSNIGKELYRVLRDWGCHVECFIDNDITKQGNYYENCEVLDVGSALARFQDGIIVNSSQNFSKEIREQLISMGVDSDSIIDYTAKKEMYYLSLAPKYYEYEFRDICIKKFGWKLELSKTTPREACKIDVEEA